MYRTLYVSSAIYSGSGMFCRYEDNEEARKSTSESEAKKTLYKRLIKVLFKSYKLNEEERHGFSFVKIIVPKKVQFHLCICNMIIYKQLPPQYSVESCYLRCLTLARRVAILATNKIRIARVLRWNYTLDFLRTVNCIYHDHVCIRNE